MDNNSRKKTRQIKSKSSLSRETKKLQTKLPTYFTTTKITLYLEDLEDVSRSNSSNRSNKQIVDRNVAVENMDSFLSFSTRLDSKIPKAADILETRREKEKLKEFIELIEKSAKRFYNELKERNIKSNYNKEVLNIKDCKHLSLEDIEDRFNKDVNFIDGICKGEIYSKRHETFKKESLLNVTDKDKLKISESLSAFTSEQLIHIVTLFRKKYDKGNRYKYSDYYFKVLLPEYSLKIFMDVHGLTNVEAVEYLKKLPIPDYITSKI